jgi:hypothetical protein
MFKSKLRAIAIPQAEHGRLAGTLAMLWGNAQFDHPPLDPISFTTGVGQHDRGYGLVDPWPLGETSEETWLEITRAGFYMPCSDLAADLITKLHLRRLTGWGSSTRRQALQAEMDREIRTRIARTNLSAETWQRIDRITRFCDSVALDFCFEQPDSGKLTVFPRNDSDETVSLRYTVQPGFILVQPWPFSVESYKNYVVGYRLEGYPDQLDPVIVPYELSPLKQGNLKRP